MAKTSRRTTALRISYPIIPSEPTGTIDTRDPLRPQVRLSLAGDIRNIYGIEIRSCMTNEVAPPITGFLTTHLTAFEAPLEILDLGLIGADKSVGATVPIGSQNYFGRTGFARSEFAFDSTAFGDDATFYFEAVVTNASFDQSREIYIEKQMRGRSGQIPTFVHTISVPPNTHRRRIRFSNPFTGYQFDPLLPSNVTGPSVTGMTDFTDWYRVYMEDEAPPVNEYSPATTIFPSAPFELHCLRLVCVSTGASKAAFDVPMSSTEGESNADVSAFGTSTSSTSYQSITEASIWKYAANEWDTITRATLFANLSSSASTGLITCGLYDITAATTAAEAVLDASTAVGSALSVSVTVPLGTLVDGHEYTLRLKSDGTGTGRFYKGGLRLYLSPLNTANIYWRFAAGPGTTQPYRVSDATGFAESPGTISNRIDINFAAYGQVDAVFVEATGTAASQQLALVNEVTNQGSQTWDLPGWFGFTSGGSDKGLAARDYTTNVNMYNYQATFAAIDPPNALVDNSLQVIAGVIFSAWQFELLAAVFGGITNSTYKPQVNAVRDSIIATQNTFITQFLSEERGFIQSSKMTFTGSVKKRLRAVIDTSELDQDWTYWGTPSPGVLQACMVVRVSPTIVSFNNSQADDVKIPVPEYPSVLMKRVYASPTDLIWDFDNSKYRIRNICFRCYFFNLLNEYSTGLELSVFLDDPGTPVIQSTSVASGNVQVNIDRINKEETVSTSVEMADNPQFAGDNVVRIKGGPLQSQYNVQPKVQTANTDQYVRASRTDHLGNTTWSDPVFISANEFTNSNAAQSDIPITTPLEAVFTYQASNSAIVWSWQGFTVKYSDGTQQFLAAGSKTFTGLQPLHLYRFYPYLDGTKSASATVQILMSNVGGGELDDPTELATTYAAGNTPLSRGAMVAVTSSSSLIVLSGTQGGVPPFGVGFPYEMAFALDDSPSPSKEYPWHTLPKGRTVYFAANFDGAKGTVSSNPSSSYTLTIKRNGGSVGTVGVSTAGNVTFTSISGATTTFVEKDRITLTPQSTPDANLKDLSVTLMGIRFGA